MCLCTESQCCELSHQLPYSTKFSWVFNFMNFQPFAKLFHRKFLTQFSCAESARDTLQRDTFEVGIALLTAASSSADDGVTVRIR